MESFGQKDTLLTYNDQYGTGDICPDSGRWVCKDHPYIEIVIKKGEIFPKCRKRGHNATWWQIEL